MGKTLYSWLIMRDNEIRSTIVRNSSIPEELGRIDYLLTDKTGTLTKNGTWFSFLDMELKKLHLGTVSYASDSMDQVREHLIESLTTLDDGTSFKPNSQINLITNFYKVMPPKPKKFRFFKEEWKKIFLWMKFYFSCHLKLSINRVESHLSLVLN